MIPCQWLPQKTRRLHQDSRHSRGSWYCKSRFKKLARVRHKPALGRVAADYYGIKERIKLAAARVHVPRQVAVDILSIVWLMHDWVRVERASAQASPHISCVSRRQRESPPPSTYTYTVISRLRLICCMSEISPDIPTRVFPEITNIRLTSLYLARDPYDAKTSSGGQKMPSAR